MWKTDLSKFLNYWCKHCTRVIGVQGQFPPHCPHCGAEAHWLPTPPNRAYHVTLKDWEFLKVNRIQP
jgi:hypothetical protein